MSLSTRITMTLVIVVAAFAVLDGWVVQRVFGERFDALEESSALTDMDRVRQALEQEVQQLANLTHSLAGAPSLRDGREGAMPRAEELIALDLDVYFVLGPTDQSQNRPVLRSRIELPAERDDAQLTNFPRASWSGQHPLLTGDLKPQQDNEALRSGIQLTGAGPMLLAVDPAWSPTGDARDQILITGRFLSWNRIARLRERTRIEFQVWQLDGQDQLPEHILQRLPQVTGSPTPHLEQGDENLLGMSTFDDLRQRPQLLIEARLPRTISAEGQAAVTFGRISVLTGAAVLVLALLILLRRIVLNPLAALTDHAESVGSTENISLRMNSQRTDELGRLSGELDSMLDKLVEARAALVDAARTAGKSEVATGILHNVGNMLSGIGISSDELSESIELLGTDDLSTVAAALEEHAQDLESYLCEDSHGKHLPPFVQALAEQQTTQRDRLRRELRSLRQGLEHVAELVRGQQQFTQRGSLTGEFDPSALMEEALRLVEQSLGQDPELEVLRFFDPNLTTVPGDRHRTLDILVNLIQNAFQAMEGQVEPRTLILRTRLEKTIACLEVEDSGPGIDSAHLTQVFAPGFTTRKDGHGYGLHTAANAALEMGGHLEARSADYAQGAAFQLQLTTQNTHARQSTTQHISVAIPETVAPSGAPYGIHQSNPSRR
ncbi:MAG: hypothetical protein CMJ86_09240 [Planctomycetes bacterium]|nr:hypothetical protein [Planctomycetota bacterium]